MTLRENLTACIEQLHQEISFSGLSWCRVSHGYLERTIRNESFHERMPTHDVGFGVAAYLPVSRKGPTVGFGRWHFHDHPEMLELINKAKVTHRRDNVFNS